MKRYVACIFSLYVLIQAGANTSKEIYDGMDQSTVDGLLKDRQLANPEMTYQIVTQKTFDSIPNPVKPTPVPDPVKQQAIIDAKNTSKTADQRLDALIKAIDLK